MIAEPMTQARETTEAQRDTVLFVCTGNTCRSPMAAALYNEARGEGDPVAFSAGLFAEEGAPISENALEALREGGVVPCPENDYTKHRARCVSEDMMKAARTVFAISSSHAMQLLMRFPQYAEKIAVLPMDVADPYGGSMDVYRACLSQLRFCVALLKGERV